MSRLPLLVALPAVLTAFAAPAALAAPRDFVVTQDHHSRTEATFNSRAAIVRFSGNTDKVAGSTKLDIQNVAAASGAVTVDVSSFDTGIGMRNEHLRGTIQADKFPTATFKLTKLTVPGNKLVPNQAVEGTAEGTMTFHGVTKPLTAPVTLTYLPEQDAKYRAGDWVAVETTFKLKLSDYGVALPQGVLGVKVADDLSIAVEGLAKAQ